MGWSSMEVIGFRLTSDPGSMVDLRWHCLVPRLQSLPQGASFRPVGAPGRELESELNSPRSKLRHESGIRSRTRAFTASVTARSGVGDNQPELDRVTIPLRRMPTCQSRDAGKSSSSCSKNQGQVPHAAIDHLSTGRGSSRSGA